ncbi:thiamine phosphate synthase, partial [Candidatus Omnitrophota bacterium]
GLRYMISKRRLLRGWRLYVILDRSLAPDRRLIAILRKALDGGADVIQLRDKRSSLDNFIEFAAGVRTICAKRRVPLIVNDRIEAALAIDADGLHLGKGDLDMGIARSLLGRNRLLGVSAHSYGDALKAKREGADYVGVGPVFRTPLKPRTKTMDKRELARTRKLRIPLVAIGGIRPDNIAAVTAMGITTVAVIRAVSLSESPLSAAKRLKEAMCS